MVGLSPGHVQQSHFRNLFFRPCEFKVGGISWFSFIILVCGLFTDTLSDDPEKGPRCVTQLKGSTSWNRTPVLGTLGLDRMLSGMLLCPTPSCHDLSRGCDGAHSLIVLLLLY